MKKDLLQFTKKGIWCEQADIYIDPWKPVSRALITHGHSDHSRYGHNSYLCSTTAAPVIKYRLGDIQIQTIDFGKRININGVKFSFHPAGHILGSAQIKVEYKGDIWVASGDYKLENDGLAEPFEPVKCNTFITESTFGLPVYDWQPQEKIFDEINHWWRGNASQGKISIITGYSLGKAQRLLKGLDTSIGKIITHGAIDNINKVMKSQKISLPETIRNVSTLSQKDYIGNIIVAPPSSLNGTLLKKFNHASVAIVSGWMALRGTRRRRAVDRGFALSDHVDWKDLNRAVSETEADRIIVTHGYSEVYAKYLEDEGLNATVPNTEFTGEKIDVVSRDEYEAG